MIRFKLTLGGEVREYLSRPVTMRTSIDAYRLLDREESAKGSYGEELIQDMLEFIVKLFGEQFSVDDLLSGCRASFFVVAPAMLRLVIATVNEQLREFEAANPPTAATAKG